VEAVSIAISLPVYLRSCPLSFIHIHITFSGAFVTWSHFRSTNEGLKNSGQWLVLWFLNGLQSLYAWGLGYFQHHLMSAPFSTLQPLTIGGGLILPGKSHIVAVELFILEYIYIQICGAV
jgi:hypothetical protein